MLLSAKYETIFLITIVRKENLVKKLLSIILNEEVFEFTILSNKLIKDKENEKGKEVEYEVLFTFESDETERNYIVYTDNKKDKKGNTKVYASIYEEDKKGKVEMIPIESEKEWKVIETILESIQNDGKKDKKEEE